MQRPLQDLAERVVHSIYSPNLGLLVQDLVDGKDDDVRRYYRSKTLRSHVQD